MKMFWGAVIAVVIMGLAGIMQNIHLNKTIATLQTQVDSLKRESIGYLLPGHKDEFDVWLYCDSAKFYKADTLCYLVRTFPSYFVKDLTTLKTKPMRRK